MFFKKNFSHQKKKKKKNSVWLLRNWRKAEENKNIERDIVW